MSRFVEGEDRRQPALLPSCLDDYVDEDNPAWVIDAFVDESDWPPWASRRGRRRQADRPAIPGRC